MPPRPCLGHGTATLTAEAGARSRRAGAADVAAVPWSSSGTAGPRLLLCAVVGAAAAAGATAGRWLVLETGEVLVLLAAPATAAGTEGSDPDVAALFPIDQCAEAQHYPRVVAAGEKLLALAASPHLRAVPLLLLYLSATVLVVGVVVTLQELRRCRAWLRAYRDELIENTQDRHVQWKKTVREQVDGLVLDGVVRNWVQTGVECALGAWGGLVLYGAPDELLGKRARRRLIRAADPSLERMLFRRGGAWEALPPWLLEYLASPTSPIRQDTEWDDGSRNREATLSTCNSTESSTDESTENEEESADTNVSGSRRDKVPFDYARVIGAKDGGRLPGKGHGGQCFANTEHCAAEIVAGAPSATITEAVVLNVMGTRGRPGILGVANAGGGPSAGQGPNTGGRRGRPAGQTIPDSDEVARYATDAEQRSTETVAEALSATITELVVSNVTGARRRPGIDDDNDMGGRPHGEQGPKIGGQQEQLRREPPLGAPRPPFSPPHLATLLQRTCLAASVLFLCHLRRSSSTRRAWGSTISVAASLGFLSTAVGAGVASVVVGANAAKCEAMASHPLVGICYAHMLDRARVFQRKGVPTDIGDRLQRMLTLLRKELRRDKRWQAAFAFVVLYGTRSWSKNLVRSTVADRGSRVSRRRKNA